MSSNLISAGGGGSAETESRGTDSLETGLADTQPVSTTSVEIASVEPESSGRAITAGVALKDEPSTFSNTREAEVISLVISTSGTIGVFKTDVSTSASSCVVSVCESSTSIFLPFTILVSSFLLATR
jgi:hypothetical protein